MKTYRVPSGLVLGLTLMLPMCHCASGISAGVGMKLNAPLLITSFPTEYRYFHSALHCSEYGVPAVRRRASATMYIKALALGFIPIMIDTHQFQLTSFLSYRFTFLVYLQNGNTFGPQTKIKYKKTKVLTYNAQNVRLW